MAVLFPLKLNGSRFYVNPMKIEAVKRSQISEVRTMAGTTFQVWPDLPDEVRFEGISYGIRSLLELRNMQASMHKNPENKEVELIYKFRKYRGYVRDMTFSADAENPRVFNYKFSYAIKSGGDGGRFSAPDMTIGQLTGLRAEFDFIQSQLRGASVAVAGLPNETAANILNVANSLGRIGMNIGRPTLPSASSFRP